MMPAPNVAFNPMMPRMGMPIPIPGAGPMMPTMIPSQ